MDKTLLKRNIILITYAIVLFMVIQHFTVVRGFFGNFFNLFIPFVYGCVIAYLFNRPYNFFYYKVFKADATTKNEKYQGFLRTFSLVAVYACALIIIGIILYLVIPQLFQSIQSLGKDLPEHYEALKTFSDDLLARLHFTDEFWTQLENIIGQVVNASANFLYNALPNILGSVVSITSGITHFLFGIIISVYILGNKATLCRQARQLTLAFLPKHSADYVLSTTHLINKTFGNFINGQLLDALILGSMCFVCMLIFRFPYALLISVIIGTSNVIPIFGPILGTIPTTFIVLMADPTHPIRAIWFIILIIVLQQIDGNIIYPRVVGGSIGLSGLWVMFAIIVFGGQFGLLGMVAGVPICAVLYILIRQATYKRLEKKHIGFTPEKDT